MKQDPEDEVGFMMGLGLGRAPNSNVPLWQREKITKCSQVDCRDESRVCSDYLVTGLDLGKICHQCVFTFEYNSFRLLG